MKQAAVLTRLQRGEAPAPKPVATILSEEAAEEAAALWKQHGISGESVGLTCVIGPRNSKDVAWSPKHDMTPKTQWLSLKQGDKTVLREVFLAKFGKGSLPRNPLVPTPSSAQIPDIKTSKTVRLTVYAKYTNEPLSTRLADALLRQIWPAKDKTVCNFASWSSEKAKDQEVALTSYVSCAEGTAEQLLKGSGSSALFVSRLAKDRSSDKDLQPYWVPRPIEASDQEYIKLARSELSTSGQATGLLHRLGGGKDLGFMRARIDAKSTAPFLWVAACPTGWAAEDLLTFLPSVGWKDAEVLGQSGKGWRFKAKSRPNKETTYLYEIGDQVLKVVPQPRKLEVQSEQSRPLARPKVPWSPEPNQETAAQEAASTQMDADSQDPDRRPAQNLPAPKKHRSTDKFGAEEIIEDPSCPLAGWSVVEAGGTGACGYKALIASLFFASKFDMILQEGTVSKDAGSLRVKTAQLLAKEARRFATSWARDEDNLEHSGKLGTSISKR